MPATRTTKVTTPAGEVTIQDEQTYTFGSADNVRSYPFELALGHASQITSVHGVLLNERPLAAIGASGGASTVHGHSAVFAQDSLLLAVGDHVVSMSLEPFAVRWSLRVDEATCFGIHLDPHDGALISHGELAISRFTATGSLAWQAYGKDIFSEQIELVPGFVKAVDFHGHEYRFRLQDGRSDA